MKKIAAAAVILGFVLAVPSVSHALLIEGAATVNARTNDPGLVIQTDVLGPISLDLDVGVPQTIDLFRIWTNERFVNFDDVFPYDIDVSFAFTDPPPPFGGDIEGSTRGVFTFNFGNNRSRGVVGNWNDPLLLSFGPAGQGLLAISLSNETFNRGPRSTLFNPRIGELSPGRNRGANVEATFVLRREPSTPVALSEPSTLALLGFGLLNLAYAGWGRIRRRSSAC